MKIERKHTYTIGPDTQLTLGDLDDIRADTRIEDHESLIDVRWQERCLIIEITCWGER